MMKQDNLRLYTMIYNTTVRKLRGVELESGELELKEIKAAANQAKNLSLRDMSDVASMELLVFFQDWDAAKDMLIKGDVDVRTNLPGLFQSARYSFFDALVSIQAARDATSYLKRKKWKKRSLKSIKIIRGLVKKGNVNLVHTLHLLEAELAALEEKYSKAENSYKSAISVATRNGFQQDRALSHELASRYFASRNDEYWSNYHMESCQKCYADYGAMAKVEQLSRRKR